MVKVAEFDSPNCYRS